MAAIKLTVATTIKSFVFNDVDVGDKCSLNFNKFFKNGSTFDV